MALIGEQFEEADEICGVVVSVRPRQDKIALWTKNAANEAAQVLTFTLINNAKQHIFASYFLVHLLVL